MTWLQVSQVPQKIPMTMSQSSNTIIAYDGCMTAVFKAISNQVVYSDNQEKYANHNAELILWIYERDKWRKYLFSD